MSTGYTEPKGDELLTGIEHELVALLAQCFNLFCRVANQQAARPADLAEVADKIHQLQDMVLANAAARAYPDMYRPLGGWKHSAANNLAASGGGTQP